MSGVRIGFVGAGFIANVHAALLARDGRATVHAVRDPNEQAAAEFAAKHGARVHATVDDLLGDTDAVYICSPNVLHASLAKRALAAGVHVFCEKPMATSIEDARMVLDAAAASRGVYQVGFNRRFASVYTTLKERLAGGDLAAMSALLKMNRGELQRPPWTGDPKVTGGYLYETPVHMLDLARFLFGEVSDVVVRARSNVYAELDDFSMLLTFASGMTAAFASSAHATWLPPFERIEVYGAHAIAVTEEMERITLGSGIGEAAHTLDFAQQPFEVRWGYAAEDRAFVDAVCGEAEARVGAADAYETTALVGRCYAEAG